MNQGKNVHLLCVPNQPKGPFLGPEIRISSGLTWKNTRRMCFQPILGEVRIVGGHRTHSRWTCALLTKADPHIPQYPQYLGVLGEGNGAL